MLLAERRQWLQLLSRQVVAQLRPSTQDKQHDPSKKHLHGYRKTQSPKSLTQRLSANLLATKIAILKSIRAVRSSLIDFKP